MLKCGKFVGPLKAAGETSKSYGKISGNRGIAGEGKTINKYLGNQYVVKASLGHIKDLPKKDLAVDVDGDFRPDYEIIEGKKKLIAELKQAAKKVGRSTSRPTLIAKAKPSATTCRKNWTGKKDGPRSSA